MKKSSNIDFTTGNLDSGIIRFAIPVFISSIFSELYNVTNSLIVGNFISTRALSAISACTWICNIFNYMFYGLGMGAGIVIANLFGAKDTKKLKKAVDTAVVFAVVGGVILTIIAEISLPVLMKWCNIRADLFADSLSYLRVYLLGNSAVLTYQMCFFILRSFGDTKHPLMYLITSSFINIILGVFFVRILHMSIVGTAIATIISQFVVDILSLNLLLKMDEIKFNIKNIEFSFEYVKKICTLGIPAGLQNMLLALSSLAIQSYVNMFPDEVIAGIGVAEKTANWAQMPSSALTTTLMSIVSQNIGAKNYDRIHEAIKKVVIISSIIVTIFTCLMFIFASPIVSLFDSNKEVIKHASTMLRITVFSFIPLNLSHIFNNANRAAGNVNAPMIIAVLTQVIGKFLFVYIGLKINFSVNVLYGGSAFGYTLAGLLATFYFFKSEKVKQLGLR